MGLGADAPRKRARPVPRDAIAALIWNPRTNKYLGLRWNKVDWETYVTGGIEPGQTAEDAARAEILQETGYRNLRLIRELPCFNAFFYHHPKKVNSFSIVTPFLFELIDDERETVSAQELEKHDVVWLSRNELQAFRLPEGHRYITDYLLQRDEL